MCPLQASLDELIERSNVKKLLINLSNLAYLTSSGLEAFLALKSKMMKNGQVLRLCALAGEVKFVFDVTHLDRVIDIFDSEQTALSDG